MNISATAIETLLIASLTSFGAGVVAALLASKNAAASRILAHVSALLGSLFALAAGVAGLMGGQLSVEIPALLPMGGTILGIDRLSAFFITIVGAAGAAASLYALGYTREYEGARSIAGMGAAFNVFLAAMVLVPLARNALTFLLLWEAMSLASYFLVMTESDQAETQRAGLLYFVMTHAGTACLLAGFLLISNATGTMDLRQWSALANTLPPHTRNAIFLLMLLGFGSKAGLVPLHIWLPSAHPAAPSHVSALMSGVMIKLGVYGLLRAGLGWLGVGPAWWGGLLMTLAAVSAVGGVLAALVESDLKRLLAYSSVENVGIIVLGAGAGMVFRAFGLNELASLAIVAALFHTVNHAAFKSLLFFGAGSVLQAVHTRDMEQMGGLIKRMPQTAVSFLAGAAAIAALPPLNGFFSEWMTFQALLLSFSVPSHAINLIFALAVAALALTGGLAAACFVRAFGIPFLALPRSDRAARAHESGPSMRAAMAALTLACIGLGLAPSGVLGFLNAGVAELTGSPANVRFSWNVVVAGSGFASVSSLWTGVALGALLLSLPLALRMWRANARRRAYETWSCGRALQTARFEYTAAAFANPFKRVFHVLYLPVKELDIAFHPESRFFVRTIAYRNEVRSVIEEFVYQPLVRMAQRAARRARVLQSGNVNAYLFYILIALIALLLLMK